MAGAGYLWMRANSSDTPAAIPLHVSDSGDQIRIEWDAKLPSVESASSGVLEMREADGTSVNVNLPLDALRTGSAFYTRHTDKVEVRLKLLYADRPAFESVVYFIRPVSSPVSSTTTAPAQTPPEQAPPATPPQAAFATPAPTVSKETKTTEPEIKPQKPRTFRPPVVSRPSPSMAGNITPTPLPITVGTPSTQPAPLNLPLSAGPVIAPPPPPPAAAASPRTETTVRAEPPRPRSGRLIWTGELGRNALLSFSPAGASLGWANGRLPGFPVRVSVHVAELVAGGM